MEKFEQINPVVKKLEEIHGKKFCTKTKTKSARTEHAGTETSTPKLSQWSTA